MTSWRRRNPGWWTRGAFMAICGPTYRGRVFWTVNTRKRLGIRPALYIGPTLRSVTEPVNRRWFRGKP